MYETILNALMIILIILSNAILVIESTKRHKIKRNKKIFKQARTTACNSVPDAYSIEILGFDYDEMESRCFDAKTGEKIFLFKAYKHYGNDTLISMISINMEGRIIKTTEWKPIKEAK